MNRRVFVGMLFCGVAAGRTWAQGTAPSQAPGPGTGPGPRRRGRRWDQQAEGEFRLGPGMGRQLMTEEEWKEHQERMRTMSAAERQKYRDETHAKMVERAKEKGIALPPTPGPPGKGPGAPR